MDEYFYNKSKRVAIKTKANGIVVPTDFLKMTPFSAKELNENSVLENIKIKTFQEGYQFTPSAVMEIHDPTKYFNMH